jgi:hypothetical protein
MDTNERKQWEGAHPLPGVHLELCPWCQQRADLYCIILFERDQVIESEPVCASCAAAAEHYIGMRKQGLTRKQALRDFGFRE